MKNCNGCNKKCEIGYEIYESPVGKSVIVPRVGIVSYWIHDIYSTGVCRDLFDDFVGTDMDKVRLKLLATRRAKDIARYCEKQR